MTLTKCIEEGNTVFNDGVNVRYVILKAFGESMALMINGTSDESGLGKMDGGKLYEPARFAGEAMDDGDDSDWVDRRLRDPPLSE